MNQQKIGALISQLRREQGLTQKQLADQLCISDKAVSKWENGRGTPDVSLLPQLSQALGVSAEQLLSGDLRPNAFTSGNMKKLQFYVCPTCGNLLTASQSADVSCCGRKLQPLPLQKADSSHQLQLEHIETEWFVSSTHGMTRDHFISFVALLTGDTLVLRKLYPEWDLATRIPFLRHSILIWYCTQHGLFYQPIP